ncbi:cytokine receptor-like factor 3 [Rhynchophorus ferrugineus]|uniref:Cytokine receptor-like factor 3 n=1 Tax=Rhynchophorus ferrugineus TaxID=354439 RepID=A0A834IMK3_RHYFE|nr:hypothetical protein GWI33_005597 [Rhynchophorus ferrugineus]
MDKEIAETVTAAKLYLNNLLDLQCDIQNAEKQVLTTYNQTYDDIKTSFASLRKIVENLLDKREQDLLGKAVKAKSDGLVPLVQCANIIKKNIKTTNHLIDQGNRTNDLTADDLGQFLQKGTLLGNLPEVPEPKEVPYISFYFDPFHESELKQIIDNIGEVYKIAPIQIQKVSQKPGAILIEWEQNFDNNEDKVRDIQEFKLQRAFGDVVKEKNLSVNFIDCYKGQETQFLLRDIQISQPYSFRICCKFDGTSDWSPWSVPQVGLTNLKWFYWENAPGCILTNDNKIVRSEHNTERTVFSDGPQVALGDSLEFTVLEVDMKTEAILALIQGKNNGIANLHDYKDGIFLIDSNGHIIIDGIEKSTVLPKFAKGLKVCFSLEKVNDDKVRINVDSSDKRVTYDWFLASESKLYFASQLSSNWKFMVE